MIRRRSVAAAVLGLALAITPGVALADSSTAAGQNDPGQSKTSQDQPGKDKPGKKKPGKKKPGKNKPGHYSFAVIGDVPYGDAQVQAFPGWIQQINAADVEMTFHVGDIKNGSTRCDDAYYAMIRKDFDSFTHPLIYTPGDNEWTDCHRVNNGAYNPLERLAYDRQVFFDRPGMTLGQHPTRVESQAYRGFPENVTLRRQRVRFTAIHVVGSNDDLLPWTGLGKTQPTSEQIAEQEARMAANSRWSSSRSPTPASATTGPWRSSCRRTCSTRPTTCPGRTTRRSHRSSRR